MAKPSSPQRANPFDILLDYEERSLAHVAGRAFDPYRHTAMHSRHVAAGAKLMPAGSCPSRV